MNAEIFPSLEYTVNWGREPKNFPLAKIVGGQRGRVGEPMITHS